MFISLGQRLYACIVLLLLFSYLLNREYLSIHRCMLFSTFGDWYISHLTEDAVFHPNPYLWSLGHTGKVFDVKNLLLALQTSPSIWSLLLIIPSHFKSGSHCGLKVNLSFLPQCMAGMPFASSMSKESARHMSERSLFPETPFWVFSSIALCVDEYMMIRKPYSDFDSTMGGKCLLQYTSSLILNFSRDLIFWFCSLPSFCLDTDIYLCWSVICKVDLMCFSYKNGLLVEWMEGSVMKLKSESWMV